MIIFHALICGCLGLILNQTMEDPAIVTLFYHRTAHFGLQLSDSNYKRSAPLVAIQPEDGCWNISNRAEIEGAIVLVKGEDQCTYFNMSLNISLWGGVGMVGRSEVGYLTPLTKQIGDERDVNISCVFIGSKDYLSIMEVLSSSPSGSVFATISDKGDISIHNSRWRTLTIPRVAGYLLFLILMVGTVLAITRLCCSRFCCQTCWNVQLYRRQIKGIPEILFSDDLVRTCNRSWGLAGGLRSSNKYVTNSTCPICLGNFEEKESIKLLPCGHGFHSECIEPWIADRKNSCPICRRSVSDKLDIEYGICCCSVTCPQNNERPSPNLRR